MMTTLTEKIADENAAQADLGYFKRLRRRILATFTFAGMLVAAIVGGLLVAAFLWILSTLALALLVGFAAVAVVLGVLFIVVSLILAFF
jgi:hypothetical protein